MINSHVTALTAQKRLIVLQSETLQSRIKRYALLRLVRGREKCDKNFKI